LNLIETLFVKNRTRTYLDGSSSIGIKLGSINVAQRKQQRPHPRRRCRRRRAAAAAAAAAADQGRDSPIVKHYF
jgi:hypothetical protein